MKGRPLVAKAYDPAKHCGAATAKGHGGPCLQGKGQRTSHPGGGNCWLHGGRTPNGTKAGARELATKAMTKLGLATGNGDPMILLAKTVQHAEGFLEATGGVLAEAAGADAPDPTLVKVSSELYAGAIRAAARVGKAAVDADVADRMAALDERATELLMRFVGELLERAVPAARRPALTVWARTRLTELATEYDKPAGAVH